jgi:adenine deaminase
MYFMLLYQLTDAFDKAKLKYAIVGGYGLALHGLVRATMDVDFVLSLRQQDFEVAEQTLGGIGLKSRLPIRAQDIIKMRKEYISKRNLIAWSFVDYKDPTRQVDILINRDLRKMETQKISVGGRKLVVATLQELMEMKKEAGRPQDLIDIKNIQEKLNEKNKDRN